MTEEPQDLQAQVEQLQAENDRLRRDRDAAQAGPSLRGLSVNSATTERVVYLPRERRCPVFRGSHGINIDEWIEEVQFSMRARHLGPSDQACFVYDHLEGEARDEIKYRPRAEREDPECVFAILKELYGCPKSYISLQQDFFSRKQLAGESLQEFSHALQCLMAKVVANSPTRVPNSDFLLRDHFVEHVNNSDLRRELKRLVRNDPDRTLLDIRSEAIRWEREGGPVSKGNGYPMSAFCATQTTSLQPKFDCLQVSSTSSQLAALTALVHKQQEQINQITQTLAAMQKPPAPQSNRLNSVVCRRCQRPGHYARDCENERVHPRPPSSVSASQVASTSPPPVEN